MQNSISRHYAPVRKLIKILFYVFLAFIAFYILKFSGITWHRLLSKETFIPGTANIITPGGVSGNDFDFSFTLSPNNQYLLFLKNGGGDSAKLALRDLSTGETKETTVPTIEFLVIFNKSCWTGDGRYCYDNKTPESGVNYTRAFVTISPFSYTESQLKPGYTNDQVFDVVDDGYCSDCTPKATIASSFEKMQKFYGNNTPFRFVVGRSGKVYFVKSIQRDADTFPELWVFDPANSSSKKLYSPRSGYNVCLDQLAVSPDENKIAFIKQSRCSGWVSGPELYIVHTGSGRAASYGSKDIAGTASLSWSSDSKDLYYVKSDGLYKLRAQ